MANDRLRDAWRARLAASERRRFLRAMAALSAGSGIASTGLAQAPQNPGVHDVPADASKVQAGEPAVAADAAKAQPAERADARRAAAAKRASSPKKAGGGSGMSDANVDDLLQ